MSNQYSQPSNTSPSNTSPSAIFLFANSQLQIEIQTKRLELRYTIRTKKVLWLLGGVLTLVAGTSLGTFLTNHAGEIKTFLQALF